MFIFVCVFVCCCLFSVHWEKSESWTNFSAYAKHCESVGLTLLLCLEAMLTSETGETMCMTVVVKCVGVPVSVGLVWDSDHPSVETTTEVARALGTAILLQDVSS